MVASRRSFLLHGCRPDDRIVYGTVRIAPTSALARACETLLADPRLAYVHPRSASNTCYQARVDQA